MAVPRSSSSFLPAHVLAQDRDSGISTEGESDAEMFFNSNSNHSSTTASRPMTRQAYPFSDDEELPSIQEQHYNQQKQQQQQQQQQLLEHQQQQEQRLNSEAVFSSESYHNHQAEQAMASIKQLVKENSWKKALKHKSGVLVYMLSKQQHGGDSTNSNKAPIFKGESVIHGFSPQSVFYVIGMRKLWDSAFEEGRLIENLNETTSITYESYHSSSSSKAYDVSLVERIECSADGVILFACTSIETPKIPKVPGRTRRQMKLQGWILKPLHTTPPSTKVTYITQESVKGWIPGLTKKSLARRPLVLADVHKYLQQKAERSKENNRYPATGLPPGTAITTTNSNTTAGNNDRTSHPSSLLAPTGNAHGQRRPSIMAQQQQQQQQQYQKPKSILQKTPKTSSLLHPKSSSMQSILTNPPPRNSSLPSPTSSRSSSVTRRIKFADDDLTSQRSSTPSSISAVHSNNNSSDDIASGPASQQESHGPATVVLPASQQHQQQNISRLYPPSRHRTSRKQCIDMLKRLASSDIDEWKEMGERNSAKLYSKSVQGSAIPILRGDVTINGSWTPEQVCSVIQCFGARKIWDEYFETGHVVERFSQKEYLVYMQMRSIFPIHSRDFSLLTVIDSDPGTGTIHVASTSVSDGLIPIIKPHVRGQIVVYGWALRPLKEKGGGGVRLTFVSHMELEGTTPLPPAIIRQLTMEVPACVDRVQWYLRQHGCPPYIRRVAGKITQEQFDSKDKIYRVSFTAKHKPSQHRQHGSWFTDIRTNPSMYGFGFNVEVLPTEHTRVELRADDMGIRVYTLDNSLEGRLVEVAIEPNLPGSTPKYTWNGVSLKEEEKKKKEDEALEEQVTEQEPQHQYHDIMPATMPPTPPLIATPENEEQKVDPSISLPPASDQLHQEQDQSLQQQQQQQRRLEPIKTKWDPSESWLHALHDSRVTTPTSTRDLMRRRNSHVLVITDELSFTGPQLSVIFLLMALCYYMGKFSCRC
ncbi:hypothetical protein BDB00DRAFT_876449 [Zychaea mexicana]|uniref:uncharacterized protein n=1 Tax=Zychaea mexicana TaxID=64656 RepID=UPI0022FE33F0|nr:uncharacterized protein BDB00DRAFT_876449 [Zychaea mexicana]KAI9489362.1 hypothetical protein BDB00DRAFT_876449 [Zychaea mexicana]